MYIPVQCPPSRRSNSAVSSQTSAIAPSKEWDSRCQDGELALRVRPGGGSGGGGSNPQKREYFDQLIDYACDGNTGWIPVTPLP
jgi:hypothetical protein